MFHRTTDKPVDGVLADRPRTTNRVHMTNPTTARPSLYRPTNDSPKGATAMHDAALHDAALLEPRHSSGLDPIISPRAPDSPGPPGADQRGPEQPSKAPVARCADGHGTLTALFFSDNVHDIARAKAMCGLCPLKEQCLAGALEREEPWGVWGGELLSGGRVIANKRPCGRPPKHPRPELVYDEMGPIGVVA